MSPLLRIAVVGATGAVGSELISLLEQRRFPLQELRPVASDRSLGEGIDVLDHDIPIETELTTLKGLDRVFVCAPPGIALEWVRRCLREEVACIDLSGGMVTRAEVPLLGTREAEGAPLAAVAPPAALALARVLSALSEETRLRSVVATWLVSAATAGRQGVDALQNETIALFNQDEPPTPDVFGREVAFDSWPELGEVDESGATPGERAVAGALARLVPGVAATIQAVQVPVFAGLGLQVLVEGEGPLETASAAARLAKTPGIEVKSEPASTRDALGGDDVQVSRIHADPTAPNRLRLWISADPIRLATLAAVEAAEPRESD